MDMLYSSVLQMLQVLLSSPLCFFLLPQAATRPALHDASPRLLPRLSPFTALECELRCSAKLVSQKQRQRQRPNPRRSARGKGWTHTASRCLRPPPPLPVAQCDFCPRHRHRHRCLPHKCAL